VTNPGREFGSITGKYRGPLQGAAEADGDDLICPLLTSAPRSGRLSTASVAKATRNRSPGVSSAAFGAQSPDLRFAPLMDMDFAVSSPLVRRYRLVSGFCPSTRTFDPCFFQTPPHGGSPCFSLGLHLHQVGRRTFTSKLLNMPSTLLTRLRGSIIESGSLISLFHSLDSHLLFPHRLTIESP